jgi:hypothetical protein
MILKPGRRLNMDLVITLISNTLESSKLGLFGVTGIAVYFVAILAAALYRIREQYLEEGQH